MRTLAIYTALLSLAVAVRPIAGQEWETIKHWDGQGTKTTESFSVDDREWRVVWSARNTNPAIPGLIQIFVYRSGDLVEIAANHEGAGSGTSYVHSAGRFHLTVNSASVAWDVRVQKRRGATGSVSGRFGEVEYARWQAYLLDTPRPHLCFIPALDTGFDIDFEYGMIVLPRDGPIRRGQFPVTDDFPPPNHVNGMVATYNPLNTWEMLSGNLRIDSSDGTRGSFDIELRGRSQEAEVESTRWSGHFQAVPRGETNCLELFREQGAR